VSNSGKYISNGKLAAIIIVAILLIDQVIKIWVKTSMSLHESIRITDWFYILFIENKGMAFGMELGSKIVLSLFRVVAIAFLIYYIRQEVRAKARTGYIVCLAMILAGAAGNLIDCMFYGLIFNASSDFYVSYFVPFGTGYAPFLMGKVVDMFYFPLIETDWPSWMPFVGGDHFIFFSPIFNFADSSISVGVVLLLLFYREEISKISLKPKAIEQSEKSE
jgi:signal peptidase II